MPKKRPQTKKKTNRALPDAKTRSSDIRKALKRFQSRKTSELIFDSAIPSDVVFDYALHPYHSFTRPKVQHTDKVDISAHILSLKQEHAVENHSLNETENISVDLLAELDQDEQMQTEDVSNDLLITSCEVEQQVADELLFNRGWSKFSLALFNKKTTRLSDPMYGDKPQIEAMCSNGKNAHEWDDIAFAPQAPSENIFSYFDFPETDEPLESDIMYLEELELHAQEEAIEPKPHAQTKWHLPHMCLPKLCLPTVHIPKFHAPKFNLPKILVLQPWQRAVASFVGISFAFVLPLHAMSVIDDVLAAQAKITSNGEEGITFLSQAAQLTLSNNPEQAVSSFALSQNSFNDAKETLDKLNAGTKLLLASLPMTKRDFSTGSALVNAGAELAIAGERMAQGFKTMNDEIQPTPISRLNIISTHLSFALPHLEDALRSLKKVNIQTLPEQYADKIALLINGLPTLIDNLKDFEESRDAIASILGREGSKRYLLIFQNNTEIRPTGGFIGSFAEIKIHDGVIEKMDVPEGGSYDLQGSLREQLIAPAPLQLLKARWEFQDGNWFPDFPTSARQLIQFYQDAGGPSIDGVISVNATFIAKLLGLLGEIEMTEYGRVINEQNFIFETQKIVEQEYDKEENRPKAFIGDLAPILLDKMLERTSQDFFSILDIGNTGLTTKDIQIFLTDNKLESEVLDRGWGGHVRATSGDYLMLVDSNLGGGKTDGVIKEEINLKVEVKQDGTIVNTAEISRTHFGIEGLAFTGVNNVDYLRLYVPKGSKLLNADGFSIPDSSLFDTPDQDWSVDDDLLYAAINQETDPASATTITQEHGKTVFGNWVQTKPGTTSTVRFTYELPFTKDTLSSNDDLLGSIKSAIGLPQTSEYSLMIQKQSGVLNRETNVKIILPENIKTLWSSQSDTEATFTNNQDEFFSMITEQL